MKNTRREFLKTTAAVAAAASATPYIFTSSQAKAADKNSKLTVASIGVGGSLGTFNRGGTIARSAAQLGQTIAVCDVVDTHNEEFNKKMGGKLNMYTDYRELFAKEKPDVVTIGTPDHWHVPIAIKALESGCHVYCEKPLTLTVDEGKQITKVVKETGKIFQVGTQQRTEMKRVFLKAVAVVQSGRLGDNIDAFVAIGGAPDKGPFKETPVPEGINWDKWLGPAAVAPYMEERRKMFRWFLEYSGGKMTDWGAHHIDIAQWALGQGHTGPVSVSGTGTMGSVVPKGFNFVDFFNGKATLPNGYNAAVTFGIDLKFGNGSNMHVTNHYKSDDGKVDFGNGILFTGSKGRIFVNRGKITGAPIESMTESEQKDLDAAVVKLYNGKEPTSHMANFFDCIESGEQPISDVFTHHRTMTSCHLCNINLMVGHDLKWDPKKEDFINDKMASALLSRPSRPEHIS
ncbi:MAG: dehydrogenase [Blastopirellula sp.]|nr:MAG: dehydrogenase [Blastopirellula sp.]